MSVIGSLSVKLGLVTVQWDQATAKAKQQSKELQTAFNAIGKELSGLTGIFKTFGGTLGVSALGFGALAASTLSFANDVKDVSSGFDISIQKTLQFRNAVETSGGKADQANKILTKLFATVNSAKEGTPTAIRLFEDLGITWQELNKMTPEQSINRVFDALANGGTDTFKKIAALKEFAGKGGAGLDIKGLDEALKQSTGIFDEHAAAIERVGNFSDNLKVTFDNLKIAMADLIAPFADDKMVIPVNTFKYALLALGGVAVISAIGSVTTSIMALSTALEVLAESGAAVMIAPWIGKILEIAVKLRYVLGAAALLYSSNLNENEDEQIRKINEQLKKDKEAADAANNQKVEDTPAVKALKAKIAMTRESMKLDAEASRIQNEATYSDAYSIKAQEVILQRKREIAAAEFEYQQYVNTGRHTTEELAAAGGILAAQKDAANAKEIDANILIASQFAEELRILRLQDGLKQHMAELDEKQLFLNHDKAFMSDYEYNLANERLNSEKKILAMKEKIAELPIGTDERGKLHYQEMVDSIQKEIDAEIRLSDTRQRLFQIDEQNRTSFSYGWNKAAFDYQQSMTNASARGAEAFNTLMGDMTTALDQFVETGKISFSSLIGSMIKDLMKMELKASAMSLFGMLKGSLGGLFSGMFGGGGGGGNASPGIVLNKFADGGSPPVGVPSLVGERGPELFIPKTAGAIVPNSSLSSALGSQPQTVYNGTVIQNMNAIDTQSAVQFLSANKNAVWAANQSAQRSLPMSR